MLPQTHWGCHHQDGLIGIARGQRNFKHESASLAFSSSLFKRHDFIILSSIKTCCAQASRRSVTCV